MLETIKQTWFMNPWKIPNKTLSNDLSLGLSFSNHLQFSVSTSGLRSNSRNLMFEAKQKIKRTTKN